MFKSLFKEDPEGDKLNNIPGADELLTEYHDKFLLVCKAMYEFGKKEKKTRHAEVAEFWRCLNEAKRHNTEEATAAINSYMEVKKKVKNKKTLACFHLVRLNYLLYLTKQIF